jgi:hypothetical protein
MAAGPGEHEVLDKILSVLEDIKSELRSREDRPKLGQQAARDHQEKHSQMV